MNTTPPRRQFLATGTALTLGGLGGVFAQLGWAESALAGPNQADRKSVV